MRLEHDYLLAIDWLENLGGKMSCLISGHKYENVLVKMGEEKIWESLKKNYLRWK